MPNPIRARVNSQISAPEVRVLDDTGQNLGVMKTADAIAKAQELGLDLIEVVATATPPVARIMSFDKYRYLREKEAKKERQQQKQTDLKQVQISARSAGNDLLIRIHQIEKFFAAGHPVEIRLRLRGREKANKEWALKKMREFMAMIPVEYKVIQEPRAGGMGMTAQIVKK